MDLIFVAAIVGAFVAGTVNGATGLGFAIVSGVFFALMLDAKSAVIMLSAITPVINGIQLFRHRAQVRQFRRILPIFAFGLLGVPVGTYLLAVLSPSAIALFLGGFTLFYVATSVFKLRLYVAKRWEPMASPVAGFISGTLSGAIGAAGPLLASYLLALDLPASTFAFTLALMFVSMVSVRVVGLTLLGQFTPDLVQLALVLMVPALLGLFTGLWIQQRLPKRVFQRGVLAVLFFAGLGLIQRGLG